MQLKIIERNSIIVLYDLGFTMNEIALKLKIHIKTVSLWLSRYSKEKNLDRKKREGNKRVTSVQEDSKIIEIIKNNNVYCSQDIKKDLELININISRSTITRRLKEHNFAFLYPIYKPKLSELHKQKRYEWAIKYFSINWFFVIFSDEASIWKERFKRKYWMEINNKIIRQTVKHSIKKQLWGCICCNENISKVLKVFDEYLNGEGYIEILREKFLPHYKGKYLLQHDNDSKHKCKQAKKFFNDNNIILIDWPAYSPDLNPIEHCWYLVKYYLTKMNVTKENFEEKIIEAWNMISKNYLYNMINSMTERLWQVIQNKGDHINY